MHSADTLINIFILNFAIPIALVDHAIMTMSVDTTLIIENPIAATSFGCIQQPLSGRTYQKILKENHTAVTTHLIIKSVAEISPLHHVYVNVTPGKHFHNV
jgi:hypothetical protein